MSLFNLVEVDNPLKLADGPMFDGFGRLRASNAESIFDSKHIRGFLEDTAWNSSVGSSGTVAINANASTVDLTVPTTNGAFAIWQTREYFNYQAGKSQQILMTFVFGAAKANVTRMAGYYDANDGVFLQQTTTDIRFVVRSSTSGAPVDTNFAAQSSWNVDKLDGTGASGVTLDLSKSQILFIDFQWLGVGRVRVGFVINGTAYICHEFYHANSTVGVYCKNPNLPLRYEIKNTAASASSTTLQAICGMVASEGGRGLRGLSLSMSMGATTKTLASGTWTPLVCIRGRTGQVRVPIVPTGFTAASASTNTCLIGLFILRAGGTHTLTGPSWQTYPVAQSSVETDIAATALTPGNATLIKSQYFSGATKGTGADLWNLNSLKACAGIAGTADIICLAGMGVGGTALNTIASLDWLEEI